MTTMGATLFPVTPLHSAPPLHPVPPLVPPLHPVPSSTPAGGNDFSQSSQDDGAAINWELFSNINTDISLPYIKPSGNTPTTPSTISQHHAGPDSSLRLLLSPPPLKRPRTAQSNVSRWGVLSEKTISKAVEATHVAPTPHSRVVDSRKLSIVSLDSLGLLDLPFSQLALRSQEPDSSADAPRNSETCLSEEFGITTNLDDDLFFATDSRSKQIIKSIGDSVPIETQEHFRAELANAAREIQDMARDVKHLLYAAEMTKAHCRYQDQVRRVLRTVTDTQIAEATDSRKPMSLFSDAHNTPPPSTPEALLKAVERLQFPVHRKKYDWNLKMWTDKERVSFLTVLMNCAVNDLHLLVTERLRWNFQRAENIGDVHNGSTVNILGDQVHFSQYPTLFEAKALVNKVCGDDGTAGGKILSETGRIEKRLQYLKEEIYQKIFRLRHPEEAPPGWKPLLPFERVLNMAEQQEQRRNILDAQASMRAFVDAGSNGENGLQEKLSRYTDLDLERMYFTSFWDTVASGANIKVEVSGRDVQIRWIHHLCPSVRRTAFTKSEELQLANVVNEIKESQKDSQESGGRPHIDWNVVAHRMGTGRTPYQYFERYRRYLHVQRVLPEWTPEDDEILVQAVLDAGNTTASRSFWSIVARSLPGRTNFQCRTRYMCVLKPKVQSLQWTPYNDMKLQILVASFGRSRWSHVARFLHNGSDMRCRERYEGAVVPAVHRLLGENAPEFRRRKNTAKQNAKTAVVSKSAEIQARNLAGVVSPE